MKELEMIKIENNNILTLFLALLQQLKPVTQLEVLKNKENLLLAVIEDYWTVNKEELNKDLFDLQVENKRLERVIKEQRTCEATAKAKESQRLKAKQQQLPKERVNYVKPNRIAKLGKSNRRGRPKKL